ncbi:hypothetical protein CRM22_007196 [Opisthorchis felineus]|uniref:Uncharacterized protein n=1 Tax=Opisthorchis felineus TaxID=147828 RepID=A0A4S2LH14_OPIFE|nr:hypothetical protein CRM22_007196 [Opisthorchis felineus]TGZ62862.1 hypothetical protein CRM22_007196 [Opisthorchis felineus]TGZ62863.1 hypothetical protein CRM22_007196 [Opisthorchis felineus]TGZ62865.1 hypothetical protein CRM22_007196 [Opisthorchis felineus]
MMFLKPGIFYSQLDSLLEQENVSLDDVLLDPNVLDECRNENKKLLAFLSQSTVLMQLVQVAVSGPDESLPLTDQFRKCHIASELLASNVPRLNYALLRDSHSLDLLYTTLLKPDVTSLASSFVYKILFTLMQYSIDEMYSFFAAKSDLPSFLLANLTRPAVLEIISRLLQFSNYSEMSTRLSNSILVPELLNRFPVPETHTASVQLLAGLLAACRLRSFPGSIASLTRRDPLLDKLESVETIQSLLSHMFQPSTTEDNRESISIQSDESFISGLMYLRCLIDPASKIEAGPEVPPLPRLDAPYLWSEPVGRTLCELILPYLGDLRRRLLVSPDSPASQAQQDRPVRLTAVRLHIARFVHYLFLAKSETLVKELLRLDFLNILMDLFFQFSLNSFLHSTCESIIRLLVYRALLTVTFESPPERSPNVSLSLDSADAVHRMFFSPNEADDKEKPFEMADIQGEVVTTGNISSPPFPNVYWAFLRQLVVEGDILERIHKIWVAEPSNSRSRGNLGHLRLIANLLTAVIGPCKTPAEPDPALISDELNLVITTDHLSAVATNGCTYESKTNPDLCLYIRTDIPADAWANWCEFVSGPLAEANEKSFINFAEFPNSVSSSDQTASNYKPSDMAISQALQNAYANYCTRPLTSTFMDQFGFAEDEFVEPSNHPNWVLDARLAEVSFALHINEDMENSTLFEQACNDIIQLNDEEVGKEGICIPEISYTPPIDANPTSPTPQEPDSDKAVCDSHAASSSEKPVKDIVPTRAKILEIFDELQSNSSEDEAVVIGCASTTATEDEDPDLVVIESGFRKSTAFSNLAEIDERELSAELVPKRAAPTKPCSSVLPVLREAELDEEQELGENGDIVCTQAELTFNDRSVSQAPNNRIYTHRPVSWSPGFCCKQLVNGKSGPKKSHRRPTPPAFQHVRTIESLHPLLCVDNVKEEEDEYSPIESTEHNLSLNRLRDKEQNGMSQHRNQTKCDTNGVYDSDARVEDAKLMDGESAEHTKLITETSSRFPLAGSTWHQPQSPESIHPNDTTEDAAIDLVEDVENIELGDLSSGFSNLTQANRTLFDALQSNWISDSNTGGGRRLIIPTKRISLRTPPMSDDTNSRIPGHTDSTNVHKISIQDPSAIDQSSATPETKKSPGTSPSLLESNSSPTSNSTTSPLNTRIPTSCGMMASIKIRHATKTHRLPPFVISENDFGPGDLLEELRSSEMTTNGLGPREFLDPDFSELPHTSDLNLNKARFRSHRTIKLRPGVDGPLNDAT